MASEPTRSAYLRLGIGFLLILLAAVFHFVFGLQPELAILDEPCLALGLIIMLSAAFPARRGCARVATGVCVAIVTTLMMLGLGEAVFRLIGFDFKGQRAAMLRLAPYYRQPRTPTGPGFFRRTGPQEWTGQVIRSWMKDLGLPGNATYRDEQVVTVRYDRNGFRNEEPLEDWDIAVAGDSFTELGHLPFEELFTTRLSRLTGWRVLNLGVSMTGPFCQLSYLEDYGVSPSLRQTIVVFFEGNDIYDMDWEFSAMRRFEATGQRRYRRIQKQTSMLKALGDWILNRQEVRSSWVTRLPVFLYRSHSGEIAVTISQVAPALEDLGPERHFELQTFFQRYRDFAAKHHVTPWVAYMPCKGRVLHDRLVPALPETGEWVWSPTRLPSLVAAGCQKEGIRFIDLTPPLREAAEARGELVFNSMIDTHLNARGAAIVGRTLAKSLGPAGQSPAGESDPPLTDRD